MSNRKRNTGKPSWLQPQPLAPSVEKLLFQNENNYDLDLGIDTQKCADAAVDSIINHADGRKKDFFKSLDPHERIQVESRIMAYTFKIQDWAEATGTVMTNDEILEEAEALAARSLFLIRENGTSRGIAKMNDVLKQRFSQGGENV